MRSSWRDRHEWCLPTPLSHSLQIWSPNRSFVSAESKNFFLHSYTHFLHCLGKKMVSHSVQGADSKELLGFAEKNKSADVSPRKMSLSLGSDMTPA